MNPASLPPRLPAPWGRLIDRNHPVSFSFEGTDYQGFQGDSIASALMANGRWLLSRSFKYHRPRGPLTLAGQDANTLVQLPSEANVLADAHPVTPGLVVTGQNYNGSLDHDRDAILGHFSRFMPVGFYYRAFYKPGGIWKYWEPFIRAKAGLGRLDLNFRPGYYDKAYLFADVAVIGSGPAGLSAALAAAESGAEVLLVEQEPVLGGSLNWARFDIAGQRAREMAQQLIGAAERHPRIRILTQATCNAWFTDNYLPIICGQRLYKARVKQCVVASGAFEQPVVFRNNDLPGVLLASAAQRLMKLYAVAPGKRAVVLTGNDQGYLAALDLADAGVEVAAVLDLRETGAMAEIVRAVKQKGIPVHAGHTVFEALPDAGKTRVAGVDVRRVTGRGQVAAEGEYIACDTLLMSAGYMPVYQLLCQAEG
ncbi:MAG: (2Fe-2S)-binding protein, partial [Zoogloeaceae bacterium]|nr:(2Fe-2S)-binding protein [Zoogloeaceae bacterium]